MSDEYKYQRQHGNFIMIPAHVFNHDKLTTTDMILFGHINGLSNQKGYCYASNGALAKKALVAKTSVSTLITKLRRLKLIKIQTIKRDGKSDERRIYPNNNPLSFDELPEVVQEKTIQEPETAGDKLCVSLWGGDHESLGGVIVDDHHNIQVLKDKRSLNTINDCGQVDNLPTEPGKTEKPEAEKAPGLPYQKPAHGFTHITDKNMSAPTKNHPFQSQAKKQGGNKPEFKTSNGKDPAILAHQEMMQHAPTPEETEQLRKKALEMVGINKKE